MWVKTEKQSENCNYLKAANFKEEGIVKPLLKNMKK